MAYDNQMAARVDRLREQLDTKKREAFRLRMKAYDNGERVPEHVHDIEHGILIVETLLDSIAVVNEMQYKKKGKGTKK